MMEGTGEVMQLMLSPCCFMLSGTLKHEAIAVIPKYLGTEGNRFSLCRCVTIHPSLRYRLVDNVLPFPSGRGRQLGLISRCTGATTTAFGPLFGGVRVIGTVVENRVPPCNVS